MIYKIKVKKAIRYQYSRKKLYRIRSKKRAKVQLVFKALSWKSKGL